MLWRLSVPVKDEPFEFGHHQFCVVTAQGCRFSHLAEPLDDSVNGLPWLFHEDFLFSVEFQTDISGFPSAVYCVQCRGYGGCGYYCKKIFSYIVSEWDGVQYALWVWNAAGHCGKAGQGLCGKPEFA